jgi:hypothetical protein
MPDEEDKMARMFVEGDVAPRESDRMAMRRLMAELDAEAAKNGVAVVGDVSIYETERSPFAIARRLRLEADVVTR